MGKRRGACMNRKQRLLLNTFAGILRQIVTVICGFILPRYMILCYGSSTNGLISSITNFLGFISFLDMGVGAVIQANLYKPLAEKDNERVSQIILSSERFFRRLAYIFIGYIAVLCVLFPTIFNDGYGTWFTISLVLIISISTLVQYLYGMSYQLLLNADQKSYVSLVLQIVTVLANTLLSIILMKFGTPVHIVKLMTTAIYVLRPLFQMVYVRRNYNIDRKIRVVGEPIKQKWNGFSQHFAAVVCQNIDVAVLTAFSTLESVSVYSVYYNVTYGVEQIIMTAATGVEALFGNMIAMGERDELIKAFSAVEWATHAGVTLVFTVAGITIVPFISVYTRGITDTDYIAPLFGALLVMAYGVLCLRVPYFRIIKAAGHFKETQNGAYISAGLNIIITIALVFQFGLIGAAVGTFVAMLYHTCYFVWYLQKHILERSAKYFASYMLIDCTVAAVSVFFARGIAIGTESYSAWIVFAFKVFGVVTAVTLIIHAIFYRNQMEFLIRLTKK